MFLIVGTFSKQYVAKDSTGAFKLTTKKKQAMEFATKEEANNFMILNRAASFSIVPKNEA